jgi:predicted nucleotidyltransferase
MHSRCLPDSFAPDVVAAIDAELERMEREEKVALPLVIESGSRAWGFPSPDSDYDCRFIFVRREEDYLTLFPKRDVLEVPMTGELDINGWDLAKALRLMLKGNAVVLEWLRSPIAYRCNPEFRDGFLALARECADRRLIGRHYLHLGERQRRTYFGGGKTLALKKLFYALRPAAALRWLRLRPEEALPPMHFPTLMAECEPGEEVAAITADLIARKAETREIGTGPLPDPVRAFIKEEFEAASELFATGPVKPSREAREKADTFFRATIEANTDNGMARED